MPKMNDEQLRLRDFIEDNFDFPTLKKIGFFNKEMKKTDYEKIAERVCKFFGYNSIYEYGLPIFHKTISTTCIAGKISDTVNNQGKLESGGAFIIATVETEFVCPICECSQDATEHTKYNNAKYPVVTIKCKGCKRQLQLQTDLSGKLSVEETMQ